MPKKTMVSTVVSTLPAFDPETGDLNVIVDTPKGNRNKFKYDEGLGLFKLSGVLAAGTVFPFDFGFVPSTLGEDGDNLDVLMLMDEPAFVGCLVNARLIGVIEAQQTEGGKTERNDRLIAIASHSHNHKDVKTLGDINVNLLTEIEHFFISYNEVRGKKFKPEGRYGPEKAERLVKQGEKYFRQNQEGGSKKSNGHKGKNR
ncbi:MAG TPA: inorganic diphosphatase [Blastocatellia bacterium]|nr:inorganic diphosphatase [Blastocatellia bacterium]